MFCCDDCIDLLLDLAYDLLDPDQEHAVRAHLAGCADCQAALQQALGQKALLARAAHVCPQVPAFVAPDDAAPAAVPAPAPATLPLAAPAPRRRRPVWGWVAAAAAVLLVAVPTGYYQHGLTARQAELAALRRQVADADGQLDRAGADFRKQRTRLAALESGKGLRLQVTGPAVYDSAVANRYRVAVEDLDGNAQAANVFACLVDSANKEIYRSEDLPIRGDRVVSLPAALPIPAEAKARLEFIARAGELAETLAEEIVAHPAEPLTQLTLNKRLYYVGEIVFFRSVTLDRFSLRPPEKASRLQQSLLDAQGKTVLACATATGPGGIASGEFALTKDLADGEYTLQVADEAGHPLAARPLRVSREVPANLYFHRQRYRPGDKVVASYQSRRPAAGNSLGNQKVNVQIVQDDGKPLDGLRQLIQVNTNDLGQADIEFQIPGAAGALPARLEIQCQEGKDKEKLVREIPLATALPLVEFFPEGGDLLADATNQVYFRATTPQGEPADLEGRVVDSHGKEVARVRTEPHDAVRGLGSFALTPRSGEKYRLQITAPAGAKTSPALPEAVTAGVALSVENPVDAEGEPIRVALRSAGAKELLVVAACRERTVAQQYLTAAAGTLRTSLAPAAGARGTLRLTVYEVRPGGVTPLAERLIFREPAQKLVLSASTDKYAYQPGERVLMKVRSAAESGAAAPSWLGGLVVDERVAPDDPTAEQSMPAFFYLLSDVGQPRDLDNADILMAPGDAARRALDLFLGTHGWRHFVPAAGPGEKVAWFHLDNRATVLKRQHTDANRARADLETKREEADGLRERGERLREQARLAFLELTDYEQRPRQILGIGLGVLVAALLLLGAGLLLWGLAELARGLGARPPLLVAMGLLGCCLMLLLAFGGRTLEDGRPESLAWLRAKPAPDLGVPRPTTPPTPPAAATTGLFTRVPAPDAAEKPRQQQGAAAQDALAKNDTNAKDLLNPYGRTANRDQSNYRSNWNPSNWNLPSVQAAEAGTMTEPLQSRFKAVALEQKVTTSYLQNSVVPTSQTGGGGQQMPGVGQPGPEKQANGGLPQPLPVPVSPVTVPPADVKGEIKGPGSQLQLPSATGVPYLDNAAKQREYAHKNNRKDNDFQDTVFWHPALVTPAGEVAVTFDLSSSPTSYRVLLYGHTADGRLGGFQGRLTTRPYPAGKR